MFKFICSHPKDGFLELRANKKGSPTVVLITVGLWLFVELFYRVATGFDMKPEAFTGFAPKAAAAKPAGKAAPSFVPEDIDTPVAASRQPSKPADMADIDEIFSIFKR